MPQALTPIALTIAGSDPSGGAGIQADLKTFSALGVYGASILTALTAQNTRDVTGVHNVPPKFIQQQAEALADDLRVTAIKTGMLGDVETLEAVIGCLRLFPGVPLVVDPVMVATSGALLLSSDAVAAVRDQLLPMATVLTPNLHEAGRLLGCDAAQFIPEMEQQGRRLCELGAQAVLMKGGHGVGAEAIDVLVTAQGVTHFAAPRIETPNTHGTGCTLSAAMAAELARGEDSLTAVVERAKRYLTLALSGGQTLHIGQGHGPVDHLVEIKSRK